MRFVADQNANRIFNLGIKKLLNFETLKIEYLKLQNENLKLQNRKLKREILIGII